MVSTPLDGSWREYVTAPSLALDAATVNGAAVTLYDKSDKPVSVVVARPTSTVHETGADSYWSVSVRRAVIVAFPTDTTDMTPAVALPTIPATLGLSVSYVMVPPLLAFVATTLK